MTAKAYEILGLLLCLALALFGAYTFGAHNATTADALKQTQAVALQQKADLAEQQRQIKQTQDNAAKAQAAAVAEAEQHQKTTIEYRTITQEQVRYVQTHPDIAACTLDDDGLRIWREANTRGATVGAAGTTDDHAVRDDGLPRHAADTSGRQAIDAAGKPHQGHADLFRLSRPTQVIDSSDESAGWRGHQWRQLMGIVNRFQAASSGIKVLLEAVPAAASPTPRYFISA
jgi:hypothetical protein